MGCSITSVEYSSPSGMVLATSHLDVKAALSSALQTCFQNAYGSPFLHPPLAPLVSKLGTGPATTEILEGTFQCPPSIDNYTRNFIEALQFPSLAACLQKVLTLLHPEDFISHWQQAKEHTSSSLSTLHFGHYKAASYSQELAFIHGHFTQLLFMTGLSISRYQAGLQVILEKKAGNIHVDNLQAILLMEGDSNAAMKIFIGACMMANVLYHNLVPAECYGSQSGCMAIQVSLNCMLTANIM